MTDPAVNDLLCGSKQIGHYLGISPYQAWRWLEAGKLPGFKLNGTGGAGSGCGGGMWYMRKSTYCREVELAEFRQQALAMGKLA